MSTAQPPQLVPEDDGKSPRGSLWPSLLLHISFALHVVLAPYTKVEESWTLHSVHDILKYGVSPDTLHAYDHFEHPGPVPRSFLSPLGLAALSAPVQTLLNRLGGSWRNPLFTQITIRLVLSQCNAFAISSFARRMRPFYGFALSDQLMLVSATQFHLAFWAGRTVPNMLAFPIVVVALSWIFFPRTSTERGLARDVWRGIALLTTASAVIRAEVAALVVSICLYALHQNPATLKPMIYTGAGALVAALAVAIPIDSYFWQRKLVWAEMQGILFNVLHGKSAEWGTLPFYAYFTNFLPRLLHVWLPFALYATIRDVAMRRILTPVAAYIGLLSLLGHKEWRFIVYVLPTLNLTALRGVQLVEDRINRTLLSRSLPKITLFWILLLPTLALTSLSAHVSMHNYPGGQALAELHRLRGASHPGSAVVQIDAFAAMTGASLFTHVRESSPRAAWTYDRTEDALRLFADFSAFDYVVTSVPDSFDGATWKRLIAAEGYAGMRRKHGVPVGFRFAPQVWVLEKR